METYHNVVHLGPDPEIAGVRIFMEKFGILLNGRPVHLTRKRLEDRMECMAEELVEFEQAAHAQDLAGMADALIDLVYFAKGTAAQLGLPWEALWNDVQMANMRKERGVTKRGQLVDVMKPPGWVGPRTIEILRDAGYRRSDWELTDSKV